MDEVLPYQIWLALSTDTREKLSMIFSIPKTGSVNVETRATPDGSSYGSVVTRDGYTPDNLRAITTEKMQTLLETTDSDFFALFEVVADNTDAILAGTFKYRPTPQHKAQKEEDETGKVEVGDRVVIKDAWQDDDKKYGDAYAKVTAVTKKGKLTLEFEDAELADILKNYVYTIKDVSKAPANKPEQLEEEIPE